MDEPVAARPWHRLPWLMSQLGRDPAFGSGPLATVAQDLLSLLLYFAIAGVIMG